MKELIATQNEQTMAISQIRGRCCVLVKPDYQSCRPVTITEHHIFFQESKECATKILNVILKPDQTNGCGTFLA